MVTVKYGEAGAEKTAVMDYDLTREDFIDVSTGEPIGRHLPPVVNLFSEIRALEQRQANYREEKVGVQQEKKVSVTTQQFSELEKREKNIGKAIQNLSFAIKSLNIARFWISESEIIYHS